MKGIVESIKEVHPKISKYLYSGVGNKLMLVESNILSEVLLRLMALSIPALPVHDSLVFPLQHRDVVRQIMEDMYRQETRFEIIVP